MTPEKREVEPCPKCGGEMDFTIQYEWKHLAKCGGCGSEAVLIDQMLADFRGLSGSIALWNRWAPKLALENLGAASGPRSWDLRR